MNAEEQEKGALKPTRFAIGKTESLSYDECSKIRVMKVGQKDQRDIDVDRIYNMLNQYRECKCFCLHSVFGR
mgnify:CR=1 FL=1